MTTAEPTIIDNLETLTVLMRHFDWAPSAGVAGRYEVWSPEGTDADDADDVDEVVVPLDPQRGDYGRLIQRALHTIFYRYGRSAQELAALLEVKSRAGLESTRWSKETNLNAGLIGWEQGESLYAAARTLLSSSAKSARQPRPHHGRASAYVAKRFLDSCLMGQTDIGSYVITAYTPSDQRFFLSRKEEESPPTSGGLIALQTLSGREILNTLESALGAVRDGLDEYKGSPNIAVFSETVAKGVSSEFARALGDIARDGEAAIEITRQTVGENQSRPREVVFEATDAPILDSVATSLASDPAPIDATLVGAVIVLDRSSAEHDRVIRLRVKSGAAGIRSAKVRLTAEQYAMAMDAHGREVDLRVTGRLEKDHSVYWLYDAHSLSLVHPQPRQVRDKFSI
jgi:hypothetical protein